MRRLLKACTIGLVAVALILVEAPPASAAFDGDPTWQITGYDPVSKQFDVRISWNWIGDAETEFLIFFADIASLGGGFPSDFDEFESVGTARHTDRQLKIMHPYAIIVVADDGTNTMKLSNFTAPSPPGLPTTDSWAISYDEEESSFEVTWLGGAAFEPDGWSFVYDGVEYDQDNRLVDPALECAASFYVPFRAYNDIEVGGEIYRLFSMVGALPLGGLTPCMEGTGEFLDAGVNVTGASDGSVTAKVSWEWTLGSNPDAYYISFIHPDGSGFAEHINLGSHRSWTFSLDLDRYDRIDIQARDYFGNIIDTATINGPFDWSRPDDPPASGLTAVCSEGEIVLHHDGGPLTDEIVQSEFNGDTWVNGLTGVEGDVYGGPLSVDGCPEAGDDSLSVDVAFVRHVEPTTSATPLYIYSSTPRTIPVTGPPPPAPEILNPALDVVDVDPGDGTDPGVVIVELSWEWPDGAEEADQFMILSPSGAASTLDPEEGNLFAVSFDEYEFFTIEARKGGDLVASATIEGPFDWRRPANPPSEGLTAVCSGGSVELFYDDQPLTDALIQDNWEADSWEDDADGVSECPDGDDTSVTVDVTFLRQALPSTSEVFIPSESSVTLTVTTADDGDEGGDDEGGDDEGGDDEGGDDEGGDDEGGDDEGPGGGGGSGGGGSTGPGSSGSTTSPASTWPTPPLEATFDTPVGVVHRLYLGLFGRLTDPGGLAYWAAQVEGGTTLSEIISRMMNTPEGRAVLGGLSNSEFVTYLYGQILGRTPDSAGHAYWVAMLSEGRISRPTLIAALIESWEMRARVVAAVNA